MKDDLIKITSKLISYETVSPEGNEFRCVNYLLSIIKQAGMETKIAARSPKRTNVIGSVGSGTKSLVIACHMDTVPAGTGWKTNPFKAFVKNGKIFGRGALDDKGPFAISLVAIKKFVKDFPQFNGKIYLIALADEEADNVYGVKYLLAQGFMADAGLIPDGGYFSKLDVGEKGCVQIKLTCYGKQAHSALDEAGLNAISELVSIIERIKNIKWPSKYNKNFSKTKVNFSMFHSGEFANVVPDRAWVQMDIRFPLGITSTDILARIQKVAKSSNPHTNIEVIYKTEPHLVTDKKLINLFLRSAKNVGFSIKTITLAGNSVAKEFNEAGIPSIVHYPMETIPAHEPNEYIDVSQMEKTSNIYYEFLKNYFSTD